jgi:hypothetical protein
MRKQLLQTVGAALLATVAMYGQNSQRLIVNVPFGFAAGSTMLPAGEYKVDLRIAPGTVALHSVEQKKAALVVTQAAQTAHERGPAKLVFKRYGDQYFLSQIWSAFTGYGRQIPPTKREMEMARNATEPGQEIVILAQLAAK